MWYEKIVKQIQGLYYIRKMAGSHKRQLSLCGAFHFDILTIGKTLLLEISLGFNVKIECSTCIKQILK